MANFLDTLVADIVQHHSSLTGRPFGPVPEIIFGDVKTQLKLFQEDQDWLKRKEKETYEQHESHQPRNSVTKMIHRFAKDLLESFIASKSAGSYHHSINAIFLKDHLKKKLEERSPGAIETTSHELGHAHHANVVLKLKKTSAGRKAYINTTKDYSQAFMEGIAMYLGMTYCFKSWGLPLKEYVKDNYLVTPDDFREESKLKKAALSMKYQNTPELFMVDGMYLPIPLSLIKRPAINPLSINSQIMLYKLGLLYVAHQIKQGRTLYGLMIHPPQSEYEFISGTGVFESAYARKNARKVHEETRQKEKREEM